MLGHFGSFGGSGMFPGPKVLLSVVHKVSRSMRAGFAKNSFHEKYPHEEVLFLETNYNSGREEY